MPPNVVVTCEQAVYGAFPFWDKGYDVLAKSPGCRAEWVDAFSRFCRSLGQPPSETSPRVDCLLFARKISAGPWVVALGSAQGNDDRGRPGAWAFHGLFMDNQDYRRAGASPFPFRKDLLRSFGPDLSLDRMRVEACQEADATGDELVDPAKIRWILRNRRLRRLSDQSTFESAHEFWKACPISLRRKRSLTTWAFRSDSEFHWSSISLPRAGDLIGSDNTDVWRFLPEEIVRPTLSANGGLSRSRVRRLLLPGSIAALLAGTMLIRYGCGAGHQSEISKTLVAEQPDLPPLPNRFPHEAIEDSALRLIEERLTDWAEKLDAPKSNTRDAAAQARRIVTALRYVGPTTPVDAPSENQEIDLTTARIYDKAVRRLAALRPWPEESTERGRDDAAWALVILGWCSGSLRSVEAVSTIRSASEADAWLNQWRDDVILPSIPDSLPPSGLESEFPELTDYRLHLSRALRLR